MRKLSTCFIMNPIQRVKIELHTALTVALGGGFKLLMLAPYSLGGKETQSL
jgi:hypothetical protein